MLTGVGLRFGVGSKEGAGVEAWAAGTGVGAARTWAEAAGTEAEAAGTEAGAAGTIGIEATEEARTGAKGGAGGII